MRLTAVILLVIGIAAAGVATLRWLRVAQREHYLAGAGSRFAWRWWTKNASHAVAFFVGVAAAICSLFVAPIAGVALVVVAFGPRGLTVRGRTSKIVWTRRLKTVGAVVVVIAALVTMSIGLAFGLDQALCCVSLLGLFAPGLVDAVLVLTKPFEERLANRFVQRAVRRLAQVRPLVVAITGSYGKTSTKGYVAHLLAGRRTVLASPRSFNNRAGLARTVNDLLMPETEVLVAEMGTYGPGEIAALCGWLTPTISVITAIGPVHLERFKSLDRTLAAKAEITKDAQVVVLNIDDTLLSGLADQLQGSKRVIRCSAERDDVDVALTRDGSTRSLFVAGERVGDASGASEVVGTNLACAIAVVLELGCTPGEVLELLASLPIAEHRLTTTTSESGVVVLDDTFNSNPAGARLALRVLKEQRTSGRIVVVTPGMVELGRLQFAENRDFAAQVAHIASDIVVVNETNRRALLAGAAAGGSDDASSEAPSVVTVATRDDATSWVREHLRAGDVVLYENDLPDHYP